MRLRILRHVVHTSSAPQTRIPLRSTCALLVALLGAVICSLLVGCSSGTTTDAQAAQQAHARASLTAGAQVTQTARVAASQTAAAIPLIPLPYSAAAPGPGCDAGGAPWTAQYAQGVACLANPARLRLTAVADASTNTSQNVVDWVFGLSGKLPATYRVSVQLSGLLNQPNTSQLQVELVVHLRTSSGAMTTFDIGFNGIQGSNAFYGIYLDGVETGTNGFILYDAATPTTIAIEVSSSGVSGLINGSTKLSRGSTPPYTVTGISLQMVGPAGDHVDFANLSVEQV